MKKTLLHILSRTSWTVIGLFITISALIRVPVIQEHIANTLASAIEDKLATKVEVKRVDLGFFNRVIIDDFVLYDQHGKKMLRAGRLSAKVDILDLLNGKISITSAQLFGLDAKLYKKTEQETANFQFVIDSLASKDTTRHTPLDLHIGSLVIRNSNISYDQYDVPDTHNKFNVKHIAVNKLSSHIMLYSLTDDNIDLLVKHLSFAEHCGLKVNDISLMLNADKSHMLLTDFKVKLPDSDICIPKFEADYVLDNGKIDIKKSKANLHLDINNFSFNDLSPLLPFNTTKLPTIKGSLIATSKADKINCTANIFTHGKSSELNLSGFASDLMSKPYWRINNIELNTDESFINELREITDIPHQLLSLGNVNVKGEFEGTMNTAKGNVSIATSNAGHLTLDGSYINGIADAHINTNDLSLKSFLDNDDFGSITANIDAKADIKQLSNPRDITIKGEIADIHYHGYDYHNIQIDGSYNNDNITYFVDIADQYLSAHAEGNAAITDKRKNIKTNFDIESIVPEKLNISSKWGNAMFSMKCICDLSGTSIDDVTGNITINDFIQNGGTVGDKVYNDAFKISEISITSDNKNNLKTLTLNSDFLDAEAFGSFDIKSLKNSIMKLVGTYIPTLVNDEINGKKNNIKVNATLKSSEWLTRLFNIDINVLQPLLLQGYINDYSNDINLYLDAPSVNVSGHHIENIKLLLRNPDNSLNTNASFVLRDNKEKEGTEVRIDAAAKNNRVESTLTWNNNEDHDFYGTINSSAQFSSKENGSFATRVSINPSDIFIGDTIWHLSSKGIEYSDNNLIVDHFSLENDNQHIYINGKASSSAYDIINVDLKNVNVAYVMNIVNFHSVDFGGFASGKASAHSLFSKPEATAHLDVAEFLFEDGHMGDLHVDAQLNNTSKQIDIDGYTDDEKGKRMLIQGYVSPQRNELDLNIDAYRVDLEFLKSYCSAFLDDIDARAKGKVRVYGPFSNINLTGKVVADGAVTVTSLNCRYTLKNDTINMIPDDILVNRMPIYDKYGNVAYMTGGLHHKHLTRMTYDFDIDANNFLAYDFHEFGESTFYGTAFLTGKCQLKGRSSELDITVNGDVEKGSKIVYNASSPDAISKQEFITWNSKNKNEGDNVIEDDKELKENNDNVRTNIRMNFLFNVTPESTLQLLMDPTTGDYISLHGSGGLRASFYNKGSFDLFGNYLIESGTYKMTIQNVIRRDFAFQPEGSITFGGDPFNAAINMQALYTLNSVPLSDLNIGNSFSSNNIRVNCLMNISGTAGNPKVEFDMDLPTVNAEAKQMIYSLINSEEEMNQQVLYLLAVGRFYSQTGNNADMQDNRNYDATTLAMQSIVSGTLSQQINNVLGSVIKNRNWNFGANISPGDEGFTNAEYEGLLNGSLFDNRLLFNGQFGYRDNAITSQQGFIGDFDLRYLLVPNGNFAVRVYNQTNDRYFTRNSLNTQGLGLILKKDFSSWRDLFGSSKKTTNDMTKNKTSK